MYVYVYAFVLCMCAHTCARKHKCAYMCLHFCQMLIDLLQPLRKLFVELHSSLIEKFYIST